MSALYFPENIQEQYDRPVIMFHCKQGDDGGSAVFPAPVGLQVSDSANYGGVTLGALGGTSLDTFDRVQNEGFSKGVTGAIDKIKRSATGSGATALFKDKLGNLGKAYGIAKGISTNPNTTTEFTGTNVRSFSFQYKLVPSSENEANSIKEIINLFRTNLYPEGELLYLEYPPKWDIAYHTLNLTQPSNLPKFGECYLTSFATTYNGAANAFFEDGNPVEYDINFSFTETKAYTRSDIKKLL